MKEGDDHCIDQPPDMNIGHSLKTRAVQKINWDDLLLRMSVSCNEVKWCVDTTPLRSLPKSTPVIMLLFRRFSWLKTWYQFYFRRLSLWSIVVQLACPLTHSSGVSFNWQSTLCSGLNTRLLEIRHSVHFLFLLTCTYSLFPGASSCTWKQRLCWTRTAFPALWSETQTSSPLSRCLVNHST